MTAHVIFSWQGIEAKVGASMACAIGNMEGLTKRKAKILARQCGSMLAGRPARERRGAKPTWSDTAARQSALREVERGIRASWTERAEQLSMDREVGAQSLCLCCESLLHPPCRSMQEELWHASKATDAFRSLQACLSVSAR